MDRLFHFGGELAYVITLSAAWVVASLPIVTIPAATAAVYGTIGAHVVDGDRRYVQPFKSAFVGGFKKVTVFGLLLIVLLGAAAFNAYYYFNAGERTVLATVLGVVQIALAAVVVVVLGFFFMLVGLHYARGYVGPAPTLKETSLVAFRHPLGAVMVLVVSVGLPLAVGFAQLWQFIIFTIGAVCYANVWLLMRIGLPELQPAG